MPSNAAIDLPIAGTLDPRQQAWGDLRCFIGGDDECVKFNVGELLKRVPNRGEVGQDATPAIGTRRGMRRRGSAILSNGPSLPTVGRCGLNARASGSTWRISAGPVISHSA